MIKQLFFTAALLVPGVAYAANPSSNLSVQVIPAGPNNPPTPPTQATVANFNTCVICIDFTAPSGGVWVNGAQPAGVNAAQPNTWLDCAGASTPIFYHGVNTGPVFGPCPTVGADPGGTGALKIQLGTNVIPANTNAFNGIQNGGGVPVPPSAIQVPTNSYTEVTYWVSSWPFNGDNAHPVFSQGHWEGEFDGSPLNDRFNYFEFDAFELCCVLNAPGAFSSSWGSWAGVHAGGPGNFFGAFPPNVSNYRPDQGYVKVGMRITSNGTDNLNKCMWFNGVLSNCVSWAPTNADGGYYTWQLSDMSSRMRFLYSPVGVYNNPNPAGQTLSSDMIAYTKSINIWACTSWQTTACKTSSADPGGY